jgi:ribulose-5-phosphate 4-epimerase/fuculose-1-phosphate aldolase/diadenosine tetraphosphate (Ap4A) HIT family hydrolase
MPRTTHLDALRADLALALRAAAHLGLSEGICNHFSVAPPGEPGRFLINPRGLHWSEVGAADIVLIDTEGRVLEGRHRVEPTAMFIHAAVHAVAGHAVVLHTHMPQATALTLTEARALDPCLSQNAMRFHGRIAVDAGYGGLALDAGEGRRIARAMQGRDVAFLGNHGVIVCGANLAHAFDDLYYLERACGLQVLAQSTGRPLAPVDDALAAQVARQTLGEREQSELFFESLRRRLPDPAPLARRDASPARTVFERLLAGELACAKVYEDDLVFAFMDAGQVNEGHVIVATKAARETLLDCSEAEAGALMRAARRIALAVQDAFAPEGITILQANRPAGWQTVPHAHLHVLPRHAGDGVELVWPRKEPGIERLRELARRLKL